MDEDEDMNAFVPVSPFASRFHRSRSRSIVLRHSSISEIPAPTSSKRSAADAGIEEAAAVVGELSKSQKKKLNKKLKGENGEAAAAPAPATAVAPSPKAAKPVATPAKKEEAPKEEKSKAAAKVRSRLPSRSFIEDCRLNRPRSSIRCCRASLRLSRITR